MTPPAPDDPPSPVALAFRRGQARARDPLDAETIASGRAITRLTSPWLRTPCPRTGHTFRVHDPVCISASGEVTLAESALSDHGSEVSTRFFAGLGHAWPAPEGVVRLMAGHPLLAPPSRCFSRRSCAVCGHTLREGDLVIVCMCSPAAPRCQGAVHRDPGRNLTCWEDACAIMPGICPVTSRRDAW